MLSNIFNAWCLFVLFVVISFFTVLLLLFVYSVIKEAIKTVKNDKENKTKLNTAKKTEIDTRPVYDQLEEVYNKKKTKKF